MPTYHMLAWGVSKSTKQQTGKGGTNMRKLILEIIAEQSGAFHKMKEMKRKMNKELITSKDEEEIKALTYYRDILNESIGATGNSIFNLERVSCGLKAG